MQVPVFKSLAKPVYWSGLPRPIFFAIFISALILFFVFGSIYVAIPITLVYMFFKLLVREDRRIFDILAESFKTKGHYYPD